VAQSIQRLESGRYQVGNVSDLANDLLVVGQYRDMLVKHWPGLEPLWVVSAFLGGVGGQARLPDAVRYGLGLLSAALDFASMRPEVLHSRMVEVQKELWGLGRVMLSLAGSTAARLMLDPETQEKMVGAHGAGLSVLMDADWEALESAAWIEFESDMARLESGELGPANPKAAALLCAAAKRGPGGMLPKDLRPRTLADWTRLLVRALRAQAVEPASPVPGTVVTLALRRLGAAALGRAAIGQLSKALARHDKRWSSMSSIEALPSSSSRPSARAQIAFVVPQATESATLQWVTPPTRGMVMVVEEALIEDAAAPLEELFGWWPGKKPLVWEAYRGQVIKRFADGYQLYAIRGDDAVGSDGRTFDGPTPSGLALAPTSDGADQLLAVLAARAAAANANPSKVDR
jgi:hypothetical protein